MLARRGAPAIRRPPASDEVLNEAVELAHDLDDPRLLARATLAIGGVGVTILQVDRALVVRLQDALAALGDRDEALRARLLARLSVELAYDPDDSLRESISLQAVESARRSADPAALAAALSARHVALSHPEHTTARLQTATEMLELARRAGDRELALQARNWRVVDLFELGDGARVQAELDAYAALAAQVRLPSYSWYVPLWRATVAALAGRLDEGRELAQRARDLGRRAGDANADVFFQAHRYMSWLADERYEQWVGEAAVVHRGENQTLTSRTGLPRRHRLSVRGHRPRRRGPAGDRHRRRRRFRHRSRRHELALDDRLRSRSVRDAR